MAERAHFPLLVLSTVSSCIIGYGLWRTGCLRWLRQLGFFLGGRNRRQVALADGIGDREGRIETYEDALAWVATRASDLAVSEQLQFYGK